MTVSPVRYNFQGVPRRGVCSTYLADRSPGDRIAVYVRPSSNFRPPSDPHTPMIMIGPGTGIAPFRGFLQERRALGHTGPNWLFFGEQHAATDYYYRDEIEQMRADGFLTELDLAFSRDQRDKVYVQHLMRKRGAQLWRWLQDGAQPVRLRYRRPAWPKTSTAHSAKSRPNTATSTRTRPRPTSSR